MAQVTVTIAGKTYRMACDDGQEEHLVSLAGRLDASIEDLKGVFGEIGDQRLTVMSAITLMDQLAEAERKLSAAEEELSGLRIAHEDLLARQAHAERRVSETLQAVAGRIEAVAEKLAAS